MALNARAMQFLRLSLQGKTEKEVAEALGVSPHTVHNRLQAIRRHYGVRSTAELIALLGGRFPGATPRPISTDWVLYG